MPPVNTSASSPDVDNEATAELPVLDVAAYESTLGEHTDSWAVPNGAMTAGDRQRRRSHDGNAGSPGRIDSDTASDVAGVRSRPQRHARNAGDAQANKTHARSHRKSAASSAVVEPSAPDAPATSAPATVASTTRATAHVAAPVTLPPSPPLIEEWRHALARAERRIEELIERARIADAERNVAVARVSAENAQLREQLAGHLESLHTARGTRSAFRARTCRSSKTSCSRAPIESRRSRKSSRR